MNFFDEQESKFESTLSDKLKNFETIFILKIKIFIKVYKTIIIANYYIHIKR